MKFLIVDAFAEETFGGNPAGVVIIPEGGDFPSGAQADGVDAQAGASRRGLSAKAARRCLHCMLYGLWLSWPFCLF